MVPDTCQASAATTALVVGGLAPTHIPFGLREPIRQHERNGPGRAGKNGSLPLLVLTPMKAEQVRRIKIEAEGDRWKGIKPKIRLIGKWLERAGFAPGGRVQVTSVAPGVLELRSGSDAV